MQVPALPEPIPVLELQPKWLCNKLCVLIPVMLLLELFSLGAYSQYFRTGAATDPAEIPVLSARLNKTGANVDRVNLYLRLSSIYIYRPGEAEAHIDSALLFIGQAKALSKRLNYKPGYNESLLLTAAAYIERNQWQKAKNMLLVTSGITKAKLLCALCDFYWYGVQTKRDTANHRMIDTAAIFGRQALVASLGSGNKTMIEKACNSLQEVIGVQLSSGRLKDAESLMNYIGKHKTLIPASVNSGFNELERKIALSRYALYRSAAPYIQNKNQGKEVRSLIPDNMVRTDADRLQLAIRFARLFLTEPGNKDEDLQQAMGLIREALKLSRTQKNDRAHSEAQVILAGIYMESNDIRSALGLLRSLKGSARLSVLNNYAEDYYWKSASSPLHPIESALDTSVLFSRQAYVLADELRDTAVKRRSIERLKTLGMIYFQKRFSGISDIYGFLLANAPKGKHPDKVGFCTMLANEYIYAAKYDKAVSYLLQAQENITPVSPFWEKVNINFAYSGIYAATDQLTKSNEYLLKIIRGRSQFPEHYSTYSVILNYCVNLIKMGKADAALQAATDFHRYGPPKTILDSCYYAECLGRIYIQKGQYKQAETFLLQTRDYAERTTYVHDISSTLGRLYLEMGDFTKAKSYYSQALRNNAGQHASYRATLYNYIIRLDTAMGDYRSATAHLLQQKKLNDSIFDVSKERHTQELVVQYQTQKKEADLRLKGENIRFLNQQALVLNQKAVLLDQKSKIQEIQLEKATLMAAKKEADFRLQAKNIRFLNQNAKLQRDKLKQANLIRDIIIAFVILVIIILLLLYRQYVLKRRSSDIILVKNQQLERLVTEKDWLLREVHHRVKNNLQTVISLLESQAAYLQDDALKAMENCQHRIFVMSLIHQKLYQSDDIKTVDMPSYIAEFLHNLADSFDVRQQIRFEQSIARIELNVNEAMPLALILNEAVTNSIKYAFPDKTRGVISIAMYPSGEEIEMVISDNGIGMQKPDTQVKAQTLGLRLMRGLCQDMEADIKFENRGGTRITIRFTANRLIDHCETPLPQTEQ